MRREGQRLKVSPLTTTTQGLQIGPSTTTQGLQISHPTTTTQGLQIGPSTTTQGLQISPPTTGETDMEQGSGQSKAPIEMCRCYRTKCKKKYDPLRPEHKTRTLEKPRHINNWAAMKYQVSIVISKMQRAKKMWFVHILNWRLNNCIVHNTLMF